jgi:hypothetical protein
MSPTYDQIDLRPVSQNGSRSYVDDQGYTYNSASYLLHDGFFLGLFSDPEHGGDVLLGNVGWLSTDYTPLYVNRDSVVGIATTYGLDDRGVEVRVPVGSRIFSSPLRPDRSWGPPSLLSNGYGLGALSPGVKGPEREAGNFTLHGVISQKMKLHNHFSSNLKSFSILF